MRILRQVLESVAAHARDCVPCECCGILLARDRDNAICHSLRAENAEKEKPELKYILGHKAHLKAVEMEINSGIQIVGYYHSHPGGGAKPSSLDAEKAVEGVFYLITAKSNGLVDNTLWILKNDRFVPVTMEICD